MPLPDAPEPTEVLRAARPAPQPPHSLRRWLRRELFGSPASGLATLALLGLAGWLLPQLFGWGLWHAVWSADAEACQAARGSGACWGMLAEKHRLIVFGRYPLAEQWRPALATLLLTALLLASGLRRCWRPALLIAWGLGLALFFVLMGGGLAGLAPVPTDHWGGLPLTLMLSTLSIALACPLAVLLAFGRRSRLALLRTLCVLYIELVRGVPLIAVLFMASFLFPLLLPAGTSPDVLLRVLAGISLFAAAYLAETVRAGLQAVPQGQIEAAESIGLGWWQTQRLVVLPQALALVLPGLLNSFISIFKDSSLITIVSLYELTGSLGLALNGDPVWRPYIIEGYLFITAIYFAVCAAMSRYSLWVEARLARSRAR
ncbi:MAG: amino acid ABC transporter permease [Leptothrix sp. (in: b-proteobacteria)]